MAIRTVVVDDEQPARQELCFLLEQLDGIDIVGQAGNGIEAMQVIREQQPDLVMLDIQMPGRTGFEVARELLLREVDTQIVFVTAYDQYAIEAFEVNAVDYLLKPVEAKRLAQSVERVRERMTSDPDAPMGVDDRQLERVLQQVNQRQTRRERIAIKVGERFQLIPSGDIIYASLVDDVITVVAGELTGTSNFRTLDELQSYLDPEIFWRVHRSHLVNINKVKEIVPWFSRNYILKMKDAKGTEIPVSRAQTKRLRGVPEPLTPPAPTPATPEPRAESGPFHAEDGLDDASADLFAAPEQLEQEHAARRAALFSRAGEEFLAWLKTFASAAVYATLIVTFGFQVARVEGKSMEPTLQDQDRLIVNKAAYRFFGEPQQGDIVMLYYPRDPDKSFVKRIVAEEGDTVRIEDGRVYVNEVLQPDLFVPPEFRSHENHGPEVVQESYYFVMGDHRNNSSDSRHWGQVPQKYIIGRVQLRWWPLGDATMF